GIAKHAQLLPVSGVVEPPYDVNYEFRHALFAPAPTLIRYQLAIPEDARLQFSYAMFKASRPGDAVRFRVVVAHEGRETELFRRRIVVRANGQGWHWREAAVDLSAFGGREVELRLETTALPRTRGYGLWGNPVIDTKRSAEDPPNVLLIGVDTLRADRLSCYGYPRNTSAHIDALAADGVRFARALSNSNWTAPSFASLLTGLTPSQHLVIHRASAIAPDIVTLAEHFRNAGWLTRGIAYKAYLYNMGFEQGFDTWLGVPAIASTADVVVAKADKWLRSNGDRRFLLFLHFDDPHQPFNQPLDFANRYGNSEVLARLGLKLPFTTTLSGSVEDCPLCTRDGNSVPAFKTAVSDLYDGEIAYLDDRIGKIVDMLERRGLYDDTIIAFVSDHGESVFDRGQFFGHGRQYLFDELVRVPLIIKPHRVRKPGVDDWARGRVVSQQVRSFDLMPTLLDMAGIDYDADAMVAVTLRPALETGGNEERPAGAGPFAIEEIPAISENVRHGAIALSWQGWKYVLDHAPGKPVEQALYRFETDPGERQNVIDRHPEITEQLRAQLIDYFMQHRPGYYLLATGGKRDDTVHLTVRTNGAVRSARSLIGPPLLEREPGVFTLDGPARGGLVLFAQFDADTDLGFEVADVGPDGAAIALQVDPEGYRAGRVIEMLAGTNWDVRAFRTLAPAMAAQKRADDATRREALEALGYIE
ncbi:MAG: sulfatase, partial [Myxococcota bacterium]